MLGIDINTDVRYKQDETAVSIVQKFMKQFNKQDVVRFRFQPYGLIK